MIRSTTPGRFSFEFFPPKSDAARRRLGATVSKLAPLKPSSVSVTFGAGGSTREGSFQTAAEIVRTTDLKVTPHISCIGSTRDELRSQLQLYREAGIDAVVALRGDVPEEEPNLPRAFEYANELVGFIKDLGGFHIAVACYPEFHPEASSPEADLENFIRKAQTGADEAITQYFYTNEAYYTFLDRVRARGVDIPIVPGLMPMTNFKQVTRFSSFCGADIPRWIRLRMEELDSDPEGQKELGIELATRQAEELLANGAPGIHFYTLNRAEPTLRIWNDLGLSGGKRPQRAQPSASI